MLHLQWPDMLEEGIFMVVQFFQVVSIINRIGAVWYRMKNLSYQCHFLGELFPDLLNGLFGKRTLCFSRFPKEVVKNEF